MITITPHSDRASWESLGQGHQAKRFVTTEEASPEESQALHLSLHTLTPPTALTLTLEGSQESKVVGHPGHSEHPRPPEDHKTGLGGRV